MIGIGGDDYYRNLGYGSLEKVSQLQKQRDEYNKASEAQHKSNVVSGAVGGAATGATIGATYGSAGGPWGAAIGLVAGGLIGSFL